MQRLELLKELSKRDILARYRGTAMGIFWSLINPLLLLAVYGVVFSVIFKSRWQINTDSNFAVILFSGLIIHGFLAEILSRSPTIILAHSNYVKKVVFPLEILVPMTVISASFHFLISLLVLLAGILLTMHTIHWTLIFLPLVILPLAVMGLGLGWLLSSLGVYLRDISQIINIIITIMLFISPVFYPAEMAPSFLKSIIYLNPISIIVEQFRNIVVFGKLPNFYHLGIYSAASVIAAVIGYAWFTKTKKGFADVI